MSTQLTAKDIRHGLWAEMVQQQVNSGFRSGSGVS